MLSTKVPNAQKAKNSRELEEYIVPNTFSQFKEMLENGQKLAHRDLGITQEEKCDTQTAFLGIVPGIENLSCVQLSCAPISQDDLKLKPWLPVCAVMVNRRVVRGAFIMDSNGLENISQSALKSENSKQLKDYYTILLSSMLFNSPHLQKQINARRVAAFHTTLKTLLNPADLQQPAQKACQTHKKDADDLLQRFKLLTYTYDHLWPDKIKLSSEEQDMIADAMGRPFCTELRVKLAIPLPLLNHHTPIALKPMLRFPGGGGSTGCGLHHTWLYPADLEQAEQLRDAFVCDIELPLLPESDGNVITKCVQKSLSWLVQELQNKFSDVNPAWSIDWSSVSLFGASFGGGMAMLAWMNASGFRVRELVLRAPLLQEYRRDPGDYAGIPITYERASKDSHEVLKILESMPFVLPRSESEPPEGMWTGPMFSIAHCFDKIWKTNTVQKSLLNLTECPDKRTRVFIRHGSEDKHVGIQSTVDAVEFMRKEWHMKIDFKVHEGKAHVWDAWEPLSFEQKSFFGMESVSV